MKTKIFESYEDFLKREDKSINGVSEDFAAEHPDFKKDNKTNTGCWNCYACSCCENCYACDYCKSCFSCKSCISCTSCYACTWCVACKNRENLKNK